MKKLILIACIVCGSSYSFSASELTLQAAYEASVSKTETVPLQEQKITQAKEKIDQAKSVILPKINFNANYLLQDDISTSAGSANKSFITNPYSLKITAAQNIYHGLKEFKAIESSEIDFKTQKNQVASLKPVSYTHLDVYKRQKLLLQLVDCICYRMFDLLVIL